MAKHRELARVVYESRTGGKSSSVSRIWRTVVVAGAMLGTPMTAVAKDPPPPAKKAPAQQEAAPEPPPPTKAELAEQKKAEVKALEKELAEANKQVQQTSAAIKTAKDATQKEQLNATLKEQQAKQKELKDRLAAAKAESAKADREARAEADAKKPRPRKPPKDRPIGRGFILS